MLNPAEPETDPTSPRAPRVLLSPGGDGMMMIGATALGGLVILMSVVVISSDLSTVHKLWCAIITLAAIMAVATFIGVTRAETNKTRVAVELCTQSLRAQIREQGAIRDSRLTALEEDFRELAAIIGKRRSSRGRGRPQERRPGPAVEVPSAMAYDVGRGAATVIPLPPGPTRQALERIHQKIHGDSNGDDREHRN